MSTFGEWSKINRTRKEKRCVWCTQIIERGQSAMRSAWEWGGEFHSGSMHPECYHAMRHFLKIEPEWEYGMCRRGRIDDENGPRQFSPDGAIEDPKLTAVDSGSVGRR